MSAPVPRTTGRGRGLLGRVVAFEAGLAAALFVVMVAINVVEIVARYLFGHSFTWIHDVTILLAAWMIFLGFTAVAYHRRDITVTFLVDRLPGRARAVARLLAALGSLAFLAVVTWAGWALLRVQRGDITPMAHIPIVLYTWPLIVAAVTLGLVWLAEVGEAAGALARRRGAP